MKKLYIILIASFILINNNINAQLKYGPRVSVGASSLGSGGTSLAFQVGLFINAELKDRMGLQPEVLFSVKNGSSSKTSQSSTGASTTTKTKYTFTYIDIPLYGYVPVSEHITFLAGPQIGIVNKATYIVTGPDVPSADSKREDIEGTKTKMGIAAGIDFNLSSPLKLGLRFSTNGGEAFMGKAMFVGVTVAYTMDW